MPSLKPSRVAYYGRFQPFHLGHYWVLKWLLKRYDEVIVLIGMANESHTWRNPFTARERAAMIRAVTSDTGFDPKRVIIESIETLSVYIGNAWYVLHRIMPVDAVATSNPSVSRAFEDANIRVIRPPPHRRHELRGEHIRRLMAARDKRWRDLVPQPVAELIDEIGGEDRVAAIASECGEGAQSVT